jgi:hypothetical protein
MATLTKIALSLFRRSSKEKHAHARIPAVPAFNVTYGDVYISSLSTGEEQVTLPNYAVVAPHCMLVDVNVGEFASIAGPSLVSHTDIGSGVEIGIDTTIKGSKAQRITIPKAASLRNHAWVDEAMPFVNYKRLTPNQPPSYAHAFREPEANNYRVSVFAGYASDISDPLEPGNSFELAAARVGANLGLELDFSQLTSIDNH